MINIDQLLVKFAEARYKVAAPPGVPAQGVPYYRGQPEAAHLFGPDGNLVEDPDLTARGSTSFMPLNAQNTYDSASPVLQPDGTYVKDVAVHQGMGNPFNPTTQGFYAMPGPGTDPGTGLGGSLATGALAATGARLIQNSPLLNPNNYVPKQPRTIANLKGQPAQNFVERYTGGDNLGGLSVSNRDSPELNRNKPNPVINAVGPKETLPPDALGRAQSLMGAVRNRGVGKGVPMPGDQNSNALMGERGSTIQRPPVAAKDAPKGLGRILRPAPPSSVNLPANNTNMGGWKGVLRAAAPRALGGIARPSTGAGRWAPLAAGVAGMALPMLANYSSDLTGAGIDPNEQGGVTSLGMPHPQKVLEKATVPVPGPSKSWFGF